MIGDGYVFFSLEQYILRLVIRGFSFSEFKCFMDVSGKFRPVCLWNKSTNEITPLIDGTIRIATVVPFSNANNYYSPVRLLHRLVWCYIYVFYHKTFLDRSELTVQKSSSSKHIPFKRFIPSFLHAKRNWNIFQRIVSGIIRQYNLHSWEFMIKAQLNGSRSLRLWNLWLIIGPNCIPRFALCHLSIHP